jgi:transposase InsO family protein
MGTASSEEIEHDRGNRARSIGISISELQIVSNQAKAYQAAERLLALEARGVEASLSAAGATMKMSEIKGFSDRRVDLARSTLTELQRSLSIDGYHKLTTYVFSEYRRTIEMWR